MSRLRVHTAMYMLEHQAALTRDAVGLPSRHLSGTFSEAQLELELVTIGSVDKHTFDLHTFDLHTVDMHTVHMHKIEIQSWLLASSIPLVSAWADRVPQLALIPATR